MPYYVTLGNCTPDEPHPGWYYTRRDEPDGPERIIGPFSLRIEALDDMTGGAYFEIQQETSRETYEADMIDAGRKHLLRKD